MNQPPTFHATARRSLVVAAPFVAIDAVLAVLLLSLGDRIPDHAGSAENTLKLGPSLASPQILEAGARALEVRPCRSGQIITGVTIVVAIAGTAIVLAECVSAASNAPMARVIRTTASGCDGPAPHLAVDAWRDAFGDERPNDPLDRGLVSAPDPMAAPVRIEALSRVG